MELTNTLIKGFSNTGSNLGKIVLGIIAFFVVFAIIVGFFFDRANAIFCIIIAIALYFIVPNLNQMCYTSISSLTEREGFAVMWTVLFFIMMVVRYLPCLHFDEKHTYLIFGTLVEDADTPVVGWSVTIGVPLVLSVGFYFLVDWMVNNGMMYIGYIAITIFLVWSIVGLVRSFFDD